ncbi:MAG TPA: peptidylprolyl isomerase [Polyangiaceae bacterium]|nr:peptidylprolyl isomerase [Polyangiaceae bacterium]
MTTPLINASLVDAPAAEDPDKVAASPAPVRSSLRPSGWLREPLLHFIVLGGLLFAVDHFETGRANDSHVIVVTPEVDSEAVETFKAARGHDPSPEELKALHKVWLDNEVLYREGLALQVDKGDPAIRERVIFKALSVVDSNVQLPKIDDAQLRAWFEKHRQKYDEPARFDFEEAALSGDNSEKGVRDFVELLTHGTPGDAKAGLRVFKNRPRQNLIDSYGAEFAEQLAASPVGAWQAFKTKDGWRAVKLDAATPPKPAVFENIRGPVLQDWKDATASEQRSAAVAALTKKYVVRYETRAESSPE